MSLHLSEQKGRYSFPSQVVNSPQREQFKEVGILKLQAKTDDSISQKQLHLLDLCRFLLV